MWKYTIAWIPMIFIAIANGLFREKVLTARLKELQAHQVSTLSLIILFSIYIWVLYTFWKPDSARQAILIGFMWLLYTVIFEFLFGHYIAGHPWSRLFHDYNILEGRIWVFVLIWIAIAPYLIYKLNND